MPDYLHNHKDFQSVLKIVADKEHINDISLVEKDYWIMHCLYSLQENGHDFDLKGGTSLSKGYKIIKRFSEDIDIFIHPTKDQEVYFQKNHDKPKHVQSRNNYYDWLCQNIEINGIISIVRDSEFEDDKLRSGGIRLTYDNLYSHYDLKDGILLEVGFDNVTPNIALDISSWAYEYAKTYTQLLDNRAIGVRCYDPGYTLIEKLQAVSTKFRKQQESKEFPRNFLRHYYDIYYLLKDEHVQKFIGSKEYYSHKDSRFRSENKDITSNEAFIMTNSETRDLYQKAFQDKSGLYFKGQPTIYEVLELIQRYASKL